MVARFLSWLRHIITDLSERAVDDALDSDAPIDIDVLSNPQHPQFHEMRRRKNTQQAREDREYF
jgi:hypothetical protein